MLLNILYTGLGLVILLLAGDVLVKGAVNLALRLGVPALLVSLTIVAFGTSAPELLISIEAIEDGVPGLALGNVVGSNIANVLMVLGIPAMIAVLHTSKCDSRKTYLFMLGATVLFMVLAFARGQFTWVEGLILLAALGVVLGDAVLTARRHRRETGSDEEIDEADDSIPTWKIVGYLLLGMIGLPVGADLLVDNAVIIAERMQVPDTVIGLTLVAIGTSLPELATTVMAAIRRQADVALGNVIGSNMFNLLAIIGIATFFGPIPVDPQILSVDLWVMAAAALLLIPFVFLGKDLTRPVGIAFTAAYVAYLVAVVV